MQRQAVLATKKEHKAALEMAMVLKLLHRLLALGQAGPIREVSNPGRKHDVGSAEALAVWIYMSVKPPPDSVHDVIPHIDVLVASSSE